MSNQENTSFAETCQGQNFLDAHPSLQQTARILYGVGRRICHGLSEDEAKTVCNKPSFLRGSQAVRTSLKVGARLVSTCATVYSIVSAINVSENSNASTASAVWNTIGAICGHSVSRTYSNFATAMQKLEVTQGLKHHNTESFGRDAEKTVLDVCCEGNAVVSLLLSHHPSTSASTSTSTSSSTSSSTSTS